MGMPGSPLTVQRLVEDYYASLYRYAYRLTGSSADAEDLTQETFCKAQLSLAQRHYAANDAHGPRISRPGGRVAAWVVPTNEELMIAQHTRRLLAGKERR